MSFASQVIEIEIPEIYKEYLIIDDPEIVSLLGTHQDEPIIVPNIEQNNNLSNVEPETPFAEVEDESFTSSCNEQALAMWAVMRFYHLLRSGITWKGPEIIEL